MDLVFQKILLEIGPFVCECRGESVHVVGYIEDKMVIIDSLGMYDDVLSSELYDCLVPTNEKMIYTSGVNISQDGEFGIMVILFLAVMWYVFNYLFLTYAEYKYTSIKK